MPTRELWSEQLAATLEAVTDHPGSTAYQLSAHVPLPPPVIGELRRPFPMTLMLSLLAELAKHSQVYAVPDKRGQRWYRTGQEGGDGDRLSRTQPIAVG